MCIKIETKANADILSKHTHQPHLASLEDLQRRAKLLQQAAPVDPVGHLAEQDHLKIHNGWHSSLNPKKDHSWLYAPAWTVKWSKELAVLLDDVHCH